MLFGTYINDLYETVQWRNNFIIIELCMQINNAYTVA